MRKYTLRHQLFRLPALVILPITWLLVKLFSKNPLLVDWVYCGKIYGNLADVISSFTRGISFSVAEVAAIGLIGLAAVLLVIRIIKLLSFKWDALVRLVSLVISIAIAASYLVFAFYVLWGFNFYRTPIDKKMALPEREYTSAELYAVCVKLSKDANRLRAELEEDADGVMTIADVSAAFDAVASAYNKYGVSNELFRAKPPKVKSLMLSSLFSKLKILGIYSCYTAEPNVNRDQPDIYICYTAAHETAHYYGWAKEDEANFLAYVIGSQADDPLVAYSCTMSALTDCAKALAAADKDAYAALRATYSEGMNRDLKSYSEYYDKHKDSPAGEVAEHINDSYLKANGQENGIAAYDEYVKLLLQYFDRIGMFSGN